MKKYRVTWEVSKYAIVEAENEDQAIDKVMTEVIESFEEEITASPMAIEE